MTTNEQLSFNANDSETLSENVIDSLESIISEVCAKHEYDKKYVEIVENKADFSVWILEPLILESTGEKIRSHRCFNIKRVSKGRPPRIEIEFSYKRKGLVSKPSDCVEKIIIEKKIDKDTGETYEVKKLKHQFALDSISVVPYIKEIIDYSMLHYRAKEKFGCCCKYNVCSDNKKCVHKNKFYASRCCWYYGNLDKGNIFYGKNRNID